MAKSEETKPQHSADCFLQPGMTWADCLCREIHPSDRPCLACAGAETSAMGCPGCLDMYRARVLRLVAR